MTFPKILAKRAMPAMTGGARRLSNVESDRDKEVLRRSSAALAEAGWLKRDRDSRTASGRKHVRRIVGVIQGRAKLGRPERAKMVRAIEI